MQEKRRGYFEEEYFIVLAVGAINRSFTIYTDTTDEVKLIEHARAQAYTSLGFTMVHCYNDKAKAPDISSANIEKAIESVNIMMGKWRMKRNYNLSPAEPGFFLFVYSLRRANIRGCQFGGDIGNIE